MARYTTNVSIPGKVAFGVHRVRLTHNGQRLTWVEHYCNDKLVGCGDDLRFLPAGTIREEAESRARRCPVREPMYWPCAA